MISNKGSFVTFGRKAQILLIAVVAMFFIGGSLTFAPVPQGSASSAINQASTVVVDSQPGLGSIYELSSAIIPASPIPFQELYCASDNGRRNYCNVNTRGGVQMVRQRSDAACIQGRTWGFDRRRIWVDRGCRADFIVGNRDDGRDRGGNRGPYRDDVGGGRGNNVQTFYCESGDMKRHWCSEGIGGTVRLVRQRSDAACIQGRTWGRDRAGVWVDRGCRADFEVRR
ncbi:MAG: DUF3011 domain-containing protein [Acidobacteria bacterium]|nr:DUF3011 domain-containing protein [Acidobacteriota bacterium]